MPAMVALHTTSMIRLNLPASQTRATRCRQLAPSQPVSDCCNVSPTLSVREVRSRLSSCQLERRPFCGMERRAEGISQRGQMRQRARRGTAEGRTSTGVSSAAAGDDSCRLSGEATGVSPQTTVLASSAPSDSAPAKRLPERGAPATGQVSPSRRSISDMDLMSLQDLISERPLPGASQVASSGWWLAAGAGTAAALPVIFACAVAGLPAGDATAAVEEATSAYTTAVATSGGQLATLATGLALAPEPSNALSLPTWTIHVASVVEWVAAMILVWRYGGRKGREAWRGLAWGMVPLLAGAMCACTWHFFYNAPSLEVLVALQGSMTVLGNCTCWLAAYRIYQASEAAKAS